MINIETELIFEQAPTQSQIQIIYARSEKILGRKKSFIELSEIEGYSRKYRLTLKIKE